MKRKSTQSPSYFFNTKRMRKVHYAPTINKLRVPSQQTLFNRLSECTLLRDPLIRRISRMALPKPFVSYWECTRRFVLPIRSTRPVVIDWGDDSYSELNQCDHPAHFYKKSQERRIRVWGPIQSFNMRRMHLLNRLSLERITQWGQLFLGNEGGAFDGAACLTVEASDSPLSQCPVTGQPLTNLCRAFQKVREVRTGLEGLDTSQCRRMTSIFSGVELISVNLGRWDTSNVESMDKSFQGVNFNGHCLNLDRWNTGKVVTFFRAFHRARNCQGSFEPHFSLPNRD